MWNWWESLEKIVIINYLFCEIRSFIFEFCFLRGWRRYYWNKEWNGEGSIVIFDKFSVGFFLIRKNYIRLLKRGRVKGKIIYFKFEFII